MSSSFFKWPSFFNPNPKPKPNSPLTTHLLNQSPHPDILIELSSYNPLPDSPSDTDTDSPSHLLSLPQPLQPDLIPDLDIFFARLYYYYSQKGLSCILTKWILDIFNVIFILCFIAFFLLFVDWNALTTIKCGVEAVESGVKPCDLWHEVIKKHPMAPFTIWKMVVLGSMFLLALYGFFNFLKFFVQFKDTLTVRRFYHNSLHVTDQEIQTTPWPRILEKVVRLQKTQRLCVVKDLTEHEILMRIMRKENFLIGMLNKGVLGFPIPWWVPGRGPGVNSRSSGRKNYLILPKTLEWTLDWCIFESMFDSKFRVQRDFTTNPLILRRRLIVVGIGMLLLSPCLVIFMLVYLFLKHAEQFYHQPSTASSRRWSNLSKWILREFNEVEHLFKHRMSNSAIHASNYLKQFPSPLISIIAKFISFVSGGFAAILIIIAFLDESLLEGQVFGRNLFWYAAVFGTVTAISRAMIAEELQVLDAEGAMTLVVRETHYMPKRWRRKENTEPVRKEFESLFLYTGMMLLEEMASILITPYLLIFVIPQRVDDILRFVSDFTLYVEGVGDVCSLSLFAFEKHGNKHYGSPCDAIKDMRSSQGKMEKSFLSFQSTYQSWQPEPHGQKFLSNLHKFKEHHANQGGAQRDNFNSLPYRRRTEDIFLRTTGTVSSPVGYNLGSLWLPDSDQKSHPYLLDLYYTSKWDPPPDEPVHHTTPNRNDLRTVINEPLYEIEEEITHQPTWDPTANLEASTSGVFLKDSILTNQDRPDNRQVTNQWWARTNVSNVVTQPAPVPYESFMEPPCFEKNPHFHLYDDSQHSGEDEGDGKEIDSGLGVGIGLGLGLRDVMAKTTYIVPEEDEGLDLAFTDDATRKGDGSSHRSVGDISGGQQVSLPVRIIPRSNDPV
ncbi:Autophagy-related protein 9 [Rhynchospora pubera]|uniref:Autophagy-related protein 9 n=1 Tax=Rhynchospora pubera TaxID=906938 RepID=A0AAV8ENF2_9POAL|nr:Autophagy-related protein 9 [Rhynchospora pubera]